MIARPDYSKAFAKPPEIPLQRRPRLAAGTRARCRLPRANVGREGLVIGIAGGTELLHEFGIRIAVNGRGFEHADLAARRNDFFARPVEVLARLVRARQHVERIAQHDRADLLQPAPDPHPEIRRPRRQLMHQDQPAAVAARLSHRNVTVSRDL